MSLQLEPKIKSIEISLNIETGNVIYKKFEDVEEAVDFVRRYFDNPDEIIRQIMPKEKRISQQRLLDPKG